MLRQLQTGYGWMQFTSTVSHSVPSTIEVYWFLKPFHCLRSNENRNQVGCDNCKRDMDGGMQFEIKITLYPHPVIYTYYIKLSWNKYTPVPVLEALLPGELPWWTSSLSCIRWEWTSAWTPPSDALAPSPTLNNQICFVSIQHYQSMQLIYMKIDLGKARKMPPNK